MKINKKCPLIYDKKGIIFKKENKSDFLLKSLSKSVLNRDELKTFKQNYLIILLIYSLIKIKLNLINKGITVWAAQLHEVSQTCKG